MNKSVGTSNDYFDFSLAPSSRHSYQLCTYALRALRVSDFIGTVPQHRKRESSHIPVDNRSYMMIYNTRLWLSRLGLERLERLRRD
jgi:hypothetical protein